MIAKKGVRKADHFAHKSGAECGTALETALHLAAKNVLMGSGRIVLPEKRAQFYGAGRELIACIQRSYRIEAIESERRLGQIVPDLVAYIEGRPVIIEIKVSHAVPPEKLSKIRGMGVSALEIDLSQAPRTFTLHELEPLLVDSAENKRWLYHKDAEAMWDRLLASGKRLLAVERGFAHHVAPCPIAARSWKGRPYANVLHDCNGCPHLITSEGLREVVCGGHNKFQLPQTDLFADD